MTFMMCNAHLTPSLDQIIGSANFPHRVHIIKGSNSFGTGTEYTDFSDDIVQTKSCVFTDETWESALSGNIAVITSNELTFTQTATQDDTLTITAWAITTYQSVLLGGESGLTYDFTDEDDTITFSVKFSLWDAT